LLQLQNGAAPVEDSVESSGQKEVKKSPLAKDSLDQMLKDLFSTKVQTATDASICVCGARVPRQIHFSCLCSSSFVVVIVLVVLAWF
jgi:hypothetical protein